MERTLSIIKPNAMHAIGDIIGTFEGASLRVVAARMAQLTRAQCEEFYAEHRERPFFGELVAFMSSAPVMLLCLQGKGAIAKNRELMGDTKPAEAAEGTIRKKYGQSVGENAVHGSDSPASAQRELGLMFGEAFVTP